jgi:crotonobetainyl-CoA:carnitine CoA-transferase CaiB-like acyl-CoA transferase
VFLTNKTQSVRKKLRIDVEDLRPHNPSMVYVRGTGQGELGPDADKGSYDVLAYWHRAGTAMGTMQADHEFVPPPPAPAFGDSIGAMTIAGGIMGALFHRERTGEATTVDVSLLGTGMWSMGAALALSLQLDMPWRPPPGGMSTGNPLVAAYRAKDDRFVSLSCLQAFRYWAEFCDLIERPDLAGDDRFASADGLRENAAEATELVREAIAERTADEWRERLADFSGQWTLVQHTLEAAVDPQATANGYIVDCATAAGTPFKLAGAPVQFGDDLPSTRRAPEFNEHDQEILGSIGLDTDTIVDLKVRGVIA